MGEYLTSIGVEIREYGAVLADVASLATGEVLLGSKENGVLQTRTSGEENISYQNCEERALPEEKDLEGKDGRKNEDVPDHGELMCSNNEQGSVKIEEEQLGSVPANPPNMTSTAKDNNALIWLNPGTCCHALYSKLPSNQVLLQQSPLALPKALKVN